jgi:Ca2+/H+ antiporter
VDIFFPLSATNDSSAEFLSLARSIRFWQTSRFVLCRCKQQLRLGFISSFSENVTNFLYLSRIILYFIVVSFSAARHKKAFLLRTRKKTNLEEKNHPREKKWNVKRSQQISKDFCMSHCVVHYVFTLVLQKFIVC